MRIHQIIGVRAFGVLAVVLLAALGARAEQNELKDFQSRVQKYITIQKKALGSVPSAPKATTDATLIVKHQQQVADAIRSLRPNAMPGQIFTPWVRGMIAGALKPQVQGTAGADAK